MITKEMTDTVAKALAAPEQNTNCFGIAWELLTAEEQETIQRLCNALAKDVRNMGMGGAFEVVGAIGLKMAKMEK